MFETIVFVNNLNMDKYIFPLGNGIGMCDGEKLCVSVIDSNGEKKVGGKEIKSLSKVWEYPLLRGIIFFFRGLGLYISSFLLSIDLEDRPEKEKNKSFKIAGRINVASSYLILVALVVASFVFGFLALGIFPAFMFNRIFPLHSNYYFRCFMIGVFRFVVIYALFAILRFLPFMQGLYSFNCAGNFYLGGKEDIMPARVYPVNFLNFLLNIFLISTFVVSLIGINIHWAVNFVLNSLIFFAIIPLVNEFLLFANRHRQGWFGAVALLTNWLVVIKPNTTHKEVVLMAKLELENYDGFEKLEKGMVSLSSLYAELATKLKAGDRYEESDVDWIIGTILNKNRAEIKLVRSVSQKEARDILRAGDRRAKGEPLSNIFGWVDFYGLRFDVNKKVLSPRMETEILVEQVLKKIEEFEAKSVLDLCTGSGAIAVTLAKLSNAKIYASDISKQALAVAESNAKKNGVKVDFAQSDLLENLKKGRKYDIIVSNPPYIKTSDLEKLDLEVKKYDPRLALDGGDDGLDFYRRIIEGAKAKLGKRGWLFFEVGKGQADDVVALMQESGYESVQTVKDYNKIERVIYGRIGK